LTVTLTGANKGLGYETVRRLVERGHTVYPGAHNAERGEAAASELGAQFVQLDVTDDSSVEAAIGVIAKRRSFGRRRTRTTAQGSESSDPQAPGSNPEGRHPFGIHWPGCTPTLDQRVTLPSSGASIRPKNRETAPTMPWLGILSWEQAGKGRCVAQFRTVG
jgi:NAD(P)-dependent dehydrogenase (short-subunit alcohol dehydrogenase family)